RRVRLRAERTAEAARVPARALHQDQRPPPHRPAQGRTARTLEAASRTEPRPLPPPSCLHAVAHGSDTDRTDRTGPDGAGTGRIGGAGREARSAGAGGP